MFKRFFFLLTILLVAPVSAWAHDECPRDAPYAGQYKEIACKRASRGMLARIFPVETLFGHSPKTLLTMMHNNSQQKYSREKTVFAMAGLLAFSGAAVGVPSFRYESHSRSSTPWTAAGCIYCIGASVVSLSYFIVSLGAFSARENVVTDYSKGTLSPNNVTSRQAMILLAEAIGHKLDGTNHKTAISLTKAAMALEDKIARSDRMQLALATAATLAIATGATALYKYFKQDEAQDTVES